jgi:hypothetical protein
MSIGMLAAIESALVARAVVDGLNFANAFVGALMALLLIASLWLRRTGRRLNPDTNPCKTRSTRVGGADRGHTSGSKTV